MTRTPPTEEWYEFVMDGHTAAIHAGPSIFEVTEAAPRTPDARITATQAHLMGIMVSGRSIADAVEAGDITVDGDLAAAERAVGLFRMPGTEPEVATELLTGAEL